MTPRLCASILLLAAAGCSRGLSRRTATAVALPTALLPTSAPALSPTATPAPTARPSLIPSPTPEPTLSATGPWLLEVNQGFLDVWNVDGSGPVRIAEDAALVDVTLMAGGPLVRNYSVAPRGGFVAFVSVADPENLKGLNLQIVTLPAGTVEAVTPLVAPEIEAQPDSFETSRQDFARRALAGSLHWSPDGTWLAFLAALKGPVFDLYTYEPASGQLQRLTDGTQAILGLDWAPGSDNLVYWGDTWIEPVLAGRGVVPADGSSAPIVYPDETAGGTVVGWSGPHTYVVYSWDISSESHNLREFDILSGEARTLWPDVFTSAALDPASGAVALCLTQDEADYFGLAKSGLYLIDLAQERAPDKIAENCFNNVYWDPFEQAFIVDTSEGEARLSPDGALSPFHAEPVVVSPDGHWRVTVASSDSLEVTGLLGELATISGGVLPQLDQILWKPDSSGFYMSDTRNLLYAAAPDFDPQVLARDPDYIAWVWP